MNHEFEASLPLISICIPTYNGADTIAMTIKSVVNQTFGNFEIIISDDCSTDNTLVIVESFRDNRIRILEQVPRTTVAANWNRCIDHASGTYIKMMGQDDILFSDCLQAEISVFNSYPDKQISFCFSKRSIISRSNQLLISSRGLTLDSPIVQLRQILPKVIRSGSNPFGEPVTVLMNHSTLTAAGKFNGDYVIDLDMWLRLLSIAPAVSTQQTLMAFRVGGGSWSHALLSTQARDTIELHNRIRHEFPNYISLFDQMIGRLMARLMQIMRPLAIKVLWKRPIPQLGKL